MESVFLFSYDPEIFKIPTFFTLQHGARAGKVGKDMRFD